MQVKHAVEVHVCLCFPIPYWYLDMYEYTIYYIYMSKLCPIIQYLQHFFNYKPARCDIFRKPTVVWFYHAGCNLTLRTRWLSGCTFEESAKPNATASRNSWLEDFRKSIRICQKSQVMDFILPEEAKVCKDFMQRFLQRLSLGKDFGRKFGDAFGSIC